MGVKASGNVLFYFFAQFKNRHLMSCSSIKIIGFFLNIIACLALSAIELVIE